MDHPPHPEPTAEDIANYSSYDTKNSPYYNNPGSFLKLGDRVRARFRIFDLPGRATDKDWGWVSAEKGVFGTVVHVEEKNWPTVRFDTGAATCVTDNEVVRIDREVERSVLGAFFDGLSFKLRHPEGTVSSEANEAMQQGVLIGGMFLRETADDGSDLSDLIAAALRELKF